MTNDIPKKFKEGDELTASLINNILEEIWRWRAAEGVPPIHVSEAASSFGPPIISFAMDGIGKLIPGDTGGGYAAGTPASPAAVTTSCTIYQTETTSGWTGSTTITNAYSIYSGTISASKTAWYWKSLDTGNYYIVTADC